MQNDNNSNNWLISIGIVIIMVISGFLGFITFESEVVSAGTTLYVGGTGPGNLSKIQDAINASIDGDTVFVYNGTYYENVVINKTLTLIGEDENTTIIDGGGNSHVILVEVNWVNITGFAIRGNGFNYAGINLFHVENCTISNNNVSNHQDGILLINANYNKIIMNNVSNNEYGILLSESNRSFISNNHIFFNSDGITNEQSNNNNISYNNVSYNYGEGIYIHDSESIDITNNLLFYNGWDDIELSLCIGADVRFNSMIDSGVFIGGRKLEYWNTHNIDTTNTLNGKPVLYWKNQTSGIIPAGMGQVILGNCSNVTVQNLEFENCSIGIELGYSTNISLIGNIIKDSLGGIFVSISDDCKIINNTAASNLMYGLYLYYSNKSIISGNEIFDNEYGIRVWFSHKNNLTSNNISRNDYGLFCLQSEQNNYTHNNISRNLDGIDILGSNNNYVFNNTVFSNRNWGIFISGSFSNIIYHNNFINNENQAFDDGSNQWDDGYPSGGNYWSDFDEPDEGAFDDYNGINQDIAGGDGIVDNGTGAGGGKKPYIIDTDSQDVYPFIKPYGNYTYLYEGWNLISLPTIQPDTNLGIVLKSIEGDYDAAQWFNTSDESDPWKHNHTSKPYHLNDLNVLNHAIGFWIHIINPGGILFKSPGNPPTTPQQIPIYPGWNLVGYPSKSDKPRDTALNNINFDTDVDSLWSYDAEDQSWIEIGASENLTVGSGYWIHSIASGMLLWDVPL